MVRILRLLSVLASAATVLVAATATVTASWKALERDEARAQAMLAVRAGLHCTVARDGGLPASVAPEALPPLCRTLVGPQTLAATVARPDIGYVRLSPTRYRLCASFHQPARRLGLHGPALDPLGCVEESVQPPAAQSATPGSPFRVWIPKRRV